MLAPLRRRRQGMRRRLSRRPAVQLPAGQRLPNLAGPLPVGILDCLCHQSATGRQSCTNIWVYMREQHLITGPLQDKPPRVCKKPHQVSNTACWAFRGMHT